MTRSRDSSAERIARAAVLAVMALAVQWLESLLPGLVPGLPVRFGFANVFVLFALLTMTKWDALTVAVLRNLLFMLVTGRVAGIFYSLSGSLLSWAVMTALLPLRNRGVVSAVGVSVAGAFLFQVGQLLAGTAAAGTAVWAYFPLMGLLSVPAGAATGFVCEMLVRRIGRKE